MPGTSANVVRPAHMTTSPDEQKGTESQPEQDSALNDAAVTPGQVRDSFCTLARQIALLAGAALRDARRRATAWWSGRRAAMMAGGASFGSRWPGLKAGFLRSMSNARGTSLALKSHFERWQNSPGALAPKWRGRLHFVRPSRKYILVSFALALALCIVFILYCVATLPITGGLQVEATQSALTFESAPKGSIRRTRRVQR